jgi:CO/xanthine dehydrogenase FAD-binding subunit
VAQRLPELEARLTGCPVDGGLGDIVTASDTAHLTPIDDIRASAAYRLDAVVTVVRRLLNDLGAGE